MGVLRVVLEQTARMRVWRTKPEKAKELESRESTTPRDWMENAGWRRLAVLNRALGEFAHTKATSKWTGARELLARLQQDVDEERAIYTARGAALDFVASLIASETVEWARSISPDITQTLLALFERVGVAVADPKDRDVEARFNHIWAQRSADLGTPDFAGAAEQRNWARRTPPDWGSVRSARSTRSGQDPAQSVSPNPFVKPTMHDVRLDR